jgi:hypothetical protein
MPLPVAQRFCDFQSALLRLVACPARQLKLIGADARSSRRAVGQR